MKFPKVNEEIRAEVVRLIAPDGEQLGIVSLKQAIDTAYKMDLDLLEVASKAEPPVCKIMDFGKYKYKQELMKKKAKKKQTQIVIKEIKLKPKINDHDLRTKIRHIEKFLKNGSKVKVSVIFRGRELAYTDKGLDLLNRLAIEVSDLGEVESSPVIDGRNMVMLLTPIKKRKREKKVAKNENS